MRRRTAGVIIGILGLVCVGLVFSVAYPFDTTKPHAATSPSERFTVASVGAFTASGSIVVDGTERLGFHGIVTPGGAWYQRVREPGLLSEGYKPAEDGTVHRRLQFDAVESAQQYRTEIVDDEDRSLIREDTAGTRTTFVIEQNTTGRTEPVTGTASVFVTSLAVAGYDVEETGSNGPTVYEPRSGWYTGATPYRLSGAAGTVRTKAETHGVLSANVTWHRTVPAGSYAEYVLARLTGDDPTMHRITFEFGANASTLDRPDWVNRTAGT